MGRPLKVLTQEQTRYYARVRARQDDVDRVRDELRRLERARDAEIVAVVKLGLPVASAALAANLSRTQVYKITGGKRG